MYNMCAGFELPWGIGSGSSSLVSCFWQLLEGWQLQAVLFLMPNSPDVRVSLPFGDGKNTYKVGACLSVA
jgi:hypothetical protein